MSGINRGVRDALAEALLLRFGGEDDEDSELEFDEDLDDEFGLDVDDDTSDDFDQVFGDDDSDDDLDDDLLDEDEPEEGFGGISAVPGRVESAHAARSAGSGVSLLGQLVAALGRGAAQSASGETLVSAVFPPAGALASRDSLPPVYVADLPGAASARELAISRGSSLPIMRPTSSFGASFDLGSLRPRTTDAERFSITRAKLSGARAVSASRVGDDRPFVEDAGAEPFLLSDGRVTEAQYGELSCVPCPSCSEVPPEAYGSTGNGCLVCDDWGGVLVPSSDVPSWKAPSAYGFLPLLIPLVVPLAQQVGAAGGQRLSAMKAAKQADLTARASRVHERLKSHLADQAADLAVRPGPAAAEDRAAPVWVVEPETFGLDQDDEEDSLGDLEDDDDTSEDLGDDDTTEDPGDPRSAASQDNRVVRVLVPRGG